MKLFMGDLLRDTIFSDVIMAACCRSAVQQKFQVHQHKISFGGRDDDSTTHLHHKLCYCIVVLQYIITIVPKTIINAHIVFFCIRVIGQPREHHPIPIVKNITSKYIPTNSSSSLQLL